MEKEKSLADIMEEEENKEKEAVKAEVEKTEEKTSNEETSEEKKQEKEEKIDVKKLGMDEKIGDLGLTKRELEADMTTPAQNMSNLKKFAEKLDIEAEVAKEQYGKKKEEEENKKEIEEMMN